LEVGEGGLLIRCELEGGVDERSKINLPALLTVQTGLNEPRYVSIMGIKKAAKKPLEVRALADLGLGAAELAPRTVVDEVFLPAETGGAEMITGDPAAIVETLLNILKEKGVRAS
jgi:electron transfer flavoprotein beta subunit